jgi:hypothetical protein
VAGLSPSTVSCSLSPLRTIYSSASTIVITIIRFTVQQAPQATAVDGSCASSIYHHCCYFFIDIFIYIIPHHSLFPGAWRIRREAEESARWQRRGRSRYSSCVRSVTANSTFVPYCLTAFCQVCSVRPFNQRSILLLIPRIKFDHRLQCRLHHQASPERSRTCAIICTAVALKAGCRFLHGCGGGGDQALSSILGAR